MNVPEALSWTPWGIWPNQGTACLAGGISGLLHPSHPHSSYPLVFFLHNVLVASAQLRGCWLSTWHYRASAARFSSPIFPVLASSGGDGQNCPLDSLSCTWPAFTIQAASACRHVLTCTKGRGEGKNTKTERKTINRDAECSQPAVGSGLGFRDEQFTACEALPCLTSFVLAQAWMNGCPDVPGWMCHPVGRGKRK